VSRLRELVESGARPILTGEAPTVDGGGIDALEHSIAEMARWVDAMNATDNPAAHAHASNVAVAIGLARLGVEPVLQVVCRDKNRIACQADIVGAALHGIENICCLTGDDVTAGDEPEARRVFDLDGPQLVSVASTLARGRYLSGRAIEPPPSLFVGAVENAAAPPLSHRAARAAKKIAAGARFLQLQICYRPERLEAFLAALQEAGMTERTAILPTIVLVRGAQPLAFMHRQVPGIDVPAETIARVAEAADPAEEAYLLALEQARHALSLPGVRGLHLTDFRRDGSLSRLCTDLELPLQRRDERGTHAHRSHLTV
jgi:methylenetetrahydrofolate reductase (NADH)